MKQTLFNSMEYAAILHGITMTEKRLEAYYIELSHIESEELIKNAFRYCIDNINTFPAVSDLKAYINEERDKMKEDIKHIKNAFEELKEDKRHNFKYKEGVK